MSAVVPCIACLCGLTVLGWSITSMIVVLVTWDDLDDTNVLAKKEVLKVQYYFAFASVGLSCVNAAVCQMQSAALGCLSGVNSLAQLVVFWVMASKVFDIDDGIENPTDGAFKTFLINFNFWAIIVMQGCGILLCCCGICFMICAGGAAAASMKDRMRMG